MELAPLFRLGGKYRDKIVEVKRLIKLLSQLEDVEPTKENCAKPNSLVLIEHRDEFLTKVKTQKWLYRKLWNLLIIHYEFDEPYEQFIDWEVGKLKESDWKPISKNPDILIWTQDWESSSPLLQ